MPFFKRFKKHKQPQSTEDTAATTPANVEVKAEAGAQPVAVQSSVDSEDVELCLGNDDAEFRIKTAPLPAVTTSSHRINMQTATEAAAKEDVVLLRSSQSISSSEQAVQYYDSGASQYNEEEDDDESIVSSSSDEGSDDDDSTTAASVDYDEDEDEGASTVVCNSSTSSSRRDDDDSMTLYSTTLQQQQPKQQLQKKKKKGSTTPLSWNTLLGCNGAGCLNPAIITTEEVQVKQQQSQLLLAAQQNHLNCSHTQSFTSYEDDDDDEYADAEYIYEEEEEEEVEEDGVVTVNLINLSEMTLQASNMTSAANADRAKSFRKDAQIDWMKRNMNGLVELAKNMPGA